jgi:hypothetical protein
MEQERRYPRLYSGIRGKGLTSHKIGMAILTGPKYSIIMKITYGVGLWQLKAP